MREMIWAEPDKRQDAEQPPSSQYPEDSTDSIASERFGSVQAPPSGLSLNPACFVCGEDNPKGMHLEFQAEGRRAVATWTPGTGWESFQGVIHGGIVSTVMDEAMSKAILSGGDEAFTADLRIRFRGKVCVGDVVRVNAWVVSVAKRRILAEASLTSIDGQERTHAWGTFLVARRD